MAKKKRQPKQKIPVSTHDTAEKLQKKPTLLGVIAHTKQTISALKNESNLFLRLTVVVAVISFLLFGATQHSQFAAYSEAVKDGSTGLIDKDDSGTQFAFLLVSTASGGLNLSLGEAQQVYFFFFYLFVWLVVIWLLRHRIAGVPTLVRDGFYNAGAPLAVSIILLGVIVLQLLPVSLGVAAFAASVNGGIVNGVVEIGIFGLIVLVLAALSFYWVCNTIIAMIVATNPGMYPIASLRAAKKVVAGRRLKIMLHLVWIMILSGIVWIATLLPALLLQQLFAQPVIPIVVITVQILTAMTVIFASAYIYLLYRKMIDESAS